MDMAAPLEIAISCANLDRMVDFYTSMLGCAVVNVIDMRISVCNWRTMDEDITRAIEAVKEALDQGRG